MKLAGRIRKPVLLVVAAASLALALVVVRQSDEPLLAGRPVGEFFPQWETPGRPNLLPPFPEFADPVAVLNGLLWMLGHDDPAWLAHYRAAYLRAPVGFRSWLAWPLPEKERQLYAFETLQSLAEQADVAKALCLRLGEVAPDWLPETAAMLSRRGLEAQAVAVLEEIAKETDSQRRNAAMTALEQHRQPGGLAALRLRANGSGPGRTF